MLELWLIERRKLEFCLIERNNLEFWLIKRSKLEFWLIESSVQSIERYKVWKGTSYDTDHRKETRCVTVGYTNNEWYVPVNRSMAHGQ